MSKILILFLISLLQLFISPFAVFAAENCSTTVSGNITYEPKTFSPPDGGKNLELIFTINNANAYNNLKGKSVRLHYIEPVRPGFGDYNTQEITIPTDKTTFAIPLTGDGKMISPGSHEAVLDLVTSPNRHDEYCTGIKYTVGDPNVCAIDPTLQSTIPPSPNNKFPLVKFSGNPNTTYYLYIWDTFHIRGNSDTKTDSSGQGEFSNINIPGSNGDKVTLKIGLNDFGASCFKDITISISAPLPGMPPPGPVPTPQPGTTISREEFVPPPSIPATAGGTSCDNAKGIATAIGCIHTEPIALIKDFLKFATAISGGLAFLMMLLGAFQMITSAGNPETLQGGRDRFQSALIGLLFVIFAVLLLKIIGVDILGLGEQFGFKP